MPPLPPLSEIFLSPDYDGEFCIPSSTLLKEMGVEHRCGYPHFYLIGEVPAQQFVCVLRWGKKSYHVCIKSLPRNSLEEALVDVCELAATIPPVEVEKWSERMLIEYPDIPKGLVQIMNQVEVGIPEFVGRYKRIPQDPWIDGPVRLTMLDAFQALGESLPLLLKTEASTLSPKQKTVQDGGMPFDISSLGVSLQGFLGEPAIELSSFYASLKGLSSTHCWRVRVRWKNSCGAWNKVEVPILGGMDLISLQKALIASIKVVWTRGPSEQQMKNAISLLLKKFGVKGGQWTISFNGTTRPICTITLRAELVQEEVSSNASAHLDMAFSGALELLEKRLKKKARPESTGVTSSSSDREVVNALLAMIRPVWFAERQYLMRMEERGSLEQTRLQKLSAYLAAIEPLRKYEITYRQRNVLAGEIVAEISHAIGRQHKSLKNVVMAEYLRVLTGRLFVEPRFKIDVTKDAFIKHAFAHRESPVEIIKQLLDGLYLRRSGEQYEVSTVGSNCMEKAICDGLLGTAEAIQPTPDIKMKLEALREFILSIGS